MIEEIAKCFCNFLDILEEVARVCRADNMMRIDLEMRIVFE